jgi:hypothetical protein
LPFSIYGDGTCAQEDLQASAELGGRELFPGFTQLDRASSTCSKFHN